MTNNYFRSWDLVWYLLILWLYTVLCCFFCTISGFSYIGQPRKTAIIKKTPSNQQENWPQWLQLVSQGSFISLFHPELDPGTLIHTQHSPSPQRVAIKSTLSLQHKGNHISLKHRGNLNVCSCLAWLRCHIALPRTPTQRTSCRLLMSKQISWKHWGLLRTTIRTRQAGCKELCSFMWPGKPYGHRGQYRSIPPSQQACGICIEHIFGSVGISACEKLVIKHDT